MEKTLTLGAFEELSGNEVMVTEGGLIQGFFNLVCGATAAQKRAEKTYNNCRNNLIQTIKKNPECVSSIPPSSIEYFNIHGVTGGYKGVQGGIY